MYVLETADVSLGLVSVQRRIRFSSSAPQTEKNGKVIYCFALGCCILGSVLSDVIRLLSFFMYFFFF